ncbi:transposase family protein [Streptomyces sp. NPDC048275]|uniref:transposase family protein n=1 Tax=Streptomyces sp. NPDC048275 TaxID=3155629 RepID=UPI0033C9655C
MPADASSPIPLAFDQLREHPGAVPGEIPGLLECLAEVPDPRDPRGVRHALVVMLALTACAVLAGATSLPAVGEWITDAPAVRPRASRRTARSAVPETVPAGGGDGASAAGPHRRRRAGPGGGPLAGRPARWGRRPAARNGGRRQDPARSGQGHGPQDSSARRLRPSLRPGPGPTRRWREDQQGTCGWASREASAVLASPPGRDPPMLPDLAEHDSG